MKTTFTQEEKQAFHELCRQFHLQAQYGLMGSLEDDGFGVSFMVASSLDKSKGYTQILRYIEISITDRGFKVIRMNCNADEKEFECTSFNEAIQKASQYLRGLKL